MALNTPHGLQKCGEINTKWGSGKRDYYLGCGYCKQLFMNLRAFGSHIEVMHEEQLFNADNIKLKHELEEEEEQAEITIEDAVMQEGETLNMAREEDNDNNDEDGELKVEAKDTGDPLSAQQKQKDQEQNEYEFEEEILEEQLDDDFDVKSRDSSSSAHSAQDDEVPDSADSVEAEDEVNLDNDDPQLLAAIIAAYKQHSELWKAKQTNKQTAELIFNQISDEVTRQLEREVSTKDVQLRIWQLRNKYHRHLAYQRQAAQEDMTYVPKWYFEQLEFLKQNIKTPKKRRLRSKGTAPCSKAGLPLPHLSQAQNLELIDIYKSFPCLWDAQHIGYRFKNQRQQALSEMLSSIGQRIGVSYSAAELQKLLYRIRYACSQEKSLKLQSERSGETLTPLYTAYSAQMAFLSDHVGPFKCPYCEKTFKGADQYKIHKSKHDGSMPFTCPLCQRGFKRAGNCTVHLRRHTRDYPYECQVCHKRFATTTDVNVHMRQHTGEKPYFCEVCGQSFRTWTFFDSHMRRHQKRPSHRCELCDKGFYENSKLTEHMKAHLNVRDQVCNVCGKAFTASKYLRQHKQIHAEKKKYVCKICGKDFAQYAGLSGHMKSHGTTVSGCAVSVSEVAAREIAGDDDEEAIHEEPQQSFE